MTLSFRTHTYFPFVFLLLTYCPLHAQLDTLRLSTNQFKLITQNDGTCFYQEGSKFFIDCPAEDQSPFPESRRKNTEPYLLLVSDGSSAKKSYTIAEANGECLTGTYKEYHTNGNLAVEGNFTPLDSLKKGECNLKTGSWTYYSEKGKELRKEEWSHGEFSSTKGLTPLPIYGLTLEVNGIPYQGETYSVSKLKSIDLKVKMADRMRAYGRFELSLLVTGDKFPVKQLKLDYSVIQYFDFKQFLSDHRLPNSNLHLEFVDTKTNTFFSTTIHLID